MGKAPTHDVKSQQIGEVEREVDELRLRTQELIEELELRLHEKLDSARATAERFKRALDVPAQLRALPGRVRAHPLPAVGIGLGVALAISGGIFLGVSRRRAAQRPMARARRRVDSWRQGLVHVGGARMRQEPIARRLLQAVLITAATVLVRAAASQLARRWISEPRQLPPSGTTTVNVV